MSYLSPSASDPRKYQQTDLFIRQSQDGLRMTNEHNPETGVRIVDLGHR
jgi:hypothetical protein